MSLDRRDADYLDHMQEAIAKIQRYTSHKCEADFLADELAQDGVIRNLEILGEAVSKLSPALKARHADIPWKAISGMRNRLIHGYLSVNMTIVWDTVVNLLPELLGKLRMIRQILGPQ